ncbi:MAG: flagellar assembly protein FlaJ [Thermoproteota archaeon]
MQLDFVKKLLSRGGDSSGEDSANSQRNGKQALRVLDEKIVYFVLLVFSLSTGEISPSELLRTAGSAGYGFYSSTVMNVYILGIKWRYGLSNSCERIALGLKTSEFKTFILKTGQVFRLGDDLKTFFKGELHSIMQYYSASYERSMESLKLMLGMYSTLMSTSAFMVAAIVILNMLGTGGGQEMVVLSIGSLTGVLAVFGLIMHLMYPKDRLLHKSRQGPDHLAKFKKTLYVALAIGTSLGGLLIYTSAIPTELAISASAAPLLLPGMAAKKVESRIRKMDDVYASFLRHFGEVYSTVGSMSQTLRTVLRSDFGILGNYVEAMLNRILNRTSVEESFDLFSKETGSVLITDGNTIMVKSIVKGCDMALVGETLATVNNKFLELRKKRLQASSAFESTALILHVLTLAVFGLMNKLIEFFSAIFGQLQGNMSIILIQPIDPGLMTLMIPVMTLTLSAINALMVKISQGGLYETVWFNIAIMMIIGGVVVYGVDLFLSQMFDELLQNDILDIAGGG